MTVITLKAKLILTWLQFENSHGISSLAKFLRVVRRTVCLWKSGKFAYTKANLQQTKKPMR